MTETSGNRPVIVDEFAGVMANIERDHEQAGWDERPACLYYIGRSRPDRFAVQGVPLGAVAHPVAELDMLADQMEAGTEPGWALILSRIGTPVGFVVCTEAWATTPAVQARTDVPLADQLGSFEVRQTIGVIGRRTLVMTRFRDGQPDWPSRPAGESLPIMQALRRMQAASRTRT